MNFNLFPPTYEQNARAEAHNRASQVQQQSDRFVRQLEGEIGERKPKSAGWEAFGAFFYGGFIGFFVGAIICAIMCADGDRDSGKVAFFICGIIGAIIAVVATHIDETNYANKYASIRNRIYRERSETPQKIEKINAETEKKISDYTTQFEDEAKRLSTSFAESKLAIEVIDWMTTGFTKAIDTADRRSHIECISVPFVFKIYNNKITCNLGTFDFEIKRCANLNSPLEQTALARAIASAIQLNITMKYPEDASGTDVIININYSYAADSVTSTLSYAADNGNYRATQDWTT